MPVLNVNQLMYIVTSLSANVDGPCDVALRKLDHITLPIEYNYQEMCIGR